MLTNLIKKLLGVRELLPKGALITMLNYEVMLSEDGRSYTTIATATDKLRLEELLQIHRGNYIKVKTIVIGELTINKTNK